MFSASLVAVLGWSALAFGGVRPWAYYPLYVGLTALGLWGLTASVHHGRRANLTLGLAALLLMVAIGLQLIPLPRNLLIAISPHAGSLLEAYDLGFAASQASGTDTLHPLSIDPLRTNASLLQVISLGIFFVGLTRMVDGARLRAMVGGLLMLGTVIALIGIVQASLATGKIYGVWTPPDGPVTLAPGGGSFGPFVNRNHFAGWMMMAIPLGVAYLCGLVGGQLSPSRRTWREWLPSREANKAILTVFGVVLMCLSLVMTLSRSGVTCFFVASAAAATLTSRRSIPASRMSIVAVYLGFGMLIVLAFLGFGAIAPRLEGVDVSLEGRLYAWQDAWRIFLDFPLTGTGLGTYSTASLFYQTYAKGIVHFAEAHNDYLQLLAEGGLLLAIPAAALLMLFIMQVRERFRENLDDGMGYWLRVGAVTGVAAMFLQESIEFSLQIPANAALFVTACAIAVRQPTGRRSGVV